MKATFHFSIVFLFFFIEIQLVQARSDYKYKVSSKQIKLITNYQQPLKCFLKVKPCSVYTKKRMTYKYKNLEANSKGFFHIEKNGSFFALKGHHLIKAGDEPVQAQTLYGLIKIPKKTSVLLKVTQGQVEVLALNNSVDIFDTFKELYTLPALFRMTLSERNSKGKISMGVPNPVNIIETIKLWGALWPGEASDFKDQVTQLKKHWRAVVEVTGEWHHQNIKREMASLKKQRTLEAEKKRKIEKENARLRQMFRKKNHY